MRTLAMFYLATIGLILFAAFQVRSNSQWVDAAKESVTHRLDVAEMAGPDAYHIANKLGSCLSGMPRIVYLRLPSWVPDSERMPMIDALLMDCAQKIILGADSFEEASLRARLLSLIGLPLSPFGAKPMSMGSENAESKTLVNQ